MTRQQQRARTRDWVFINYAAILAAVALPLLATMWDLVVLAVAVLLVLVAVLTVSYQRAFGRTGLWRLTHTPAEDLDEREQHLTRTALATAYRWMAVTTLVAIYGIILVHDPMVGTWLAWLKPSALVLPVGLIYIAHTLPAALIGWSELPPEENEPVAARAMES